MVSHQSYVKTVLFEDWLYLLIIVVKVASFEEKLKFCKGSVIEFSNLRGQSLFVNSMPSLHDYVKIGTVRR